MPPRPRRASIDARRTPARHAHPSSCTRPFNSPPPPSSGARAFATSRASRSAGKRSRTRVVSRSYRIAMGDTASGRARARERRARAPTRARADFDAREFRASRAAIGRRARARARARGADDRSIDRARRAGRDARARRGRRRGRRRARGRGRGRAGDARERPGAARRGGAARRAVEGWDGMDATRTRERATDDERAITRMQFARGEGAKASKLEDARERRGATDVDAGCDRAGALEERVAG